MTAYYNEIDPYAAQWLRNLIKEELISFGIVDERKIEEVRPDDISKFTQCHFFAGIGGWSYALKSSGWPDNRPVWTGSCPCQPFSSAASGRNARGNDQKRHLWPTWFRLISECKPCTIFGEQTAQAGDWFDGVCNDLEAVGYAIGAAVLPACSVGQDHARARLYFVGDTDRHRQSGVTVHEKASWLSGYYSHAYRVVPTHGIPNRMATLRAFGNAIVPQVAAEFIKSVSETHTAA